MRKIRIAYVNDYGVDSGTLKNCATGHSPKHHLWGIYDLLSDPQYTIDLIDNNYFSRLSNKSVNKAHSLLRWIGNQIKLAVRTADSDIVYGTQVCFSMMPISLPAILRYFGLAKAKIVITLQNPQVKIPRFHKYDKLIFLSCEVMEVFLQESPELASICEHVFWGPDLAFYDALKAGFNPEKTATLISNGKTGRDPETFLAACDAEQVSGLLVHNRTFQPSEAQRTNPLLHLVSGTGTGNVISDVENVRLLCSCDIMVLPIRPTRPGLYGTTSFLDAIALGMPIIMSDNTMIGVDVEEQQFGFFYKAGDSKSLSKQIQFLQSNPHLLVEYRSRARIFAESHDLQAYSQRIVEIFQELLKSS